MRAPHGSVAAWFSPELLNGGPQRQFSWRIVQLTQWPCVGQPFNGMFRSEEKNQKNLEDVLSVTKRNVLKLRFVFTACIIAAASVGLQCVR